MTFQTRTRTPLAVLIAWLSRQVSTARRRPTDPPRTIAAANLSCHIRRDIGLDCPPLRRGSHWP